jgi:hypothetical protein
MIAQRQTAAEDTTAKPVKAQKIAEAKLIAG